MRHELRHHPIHIIQADLSILIFIKQRKTEFVPFRGCTVLVDVYYSCKLLKCDMLVLILISHSEDPIAQERVASLTQEPEEMSELLFVHETCIRQSFDMIL